MAPLPSITGTSARPLRSLLINPNSTSSMTDACLHSLHSTLPAHVTVTGFTAPHPGPSAIESYSDSVLSAAATLTAVIPIARSYDAFLVACFSAHPVIPALREELDGPVIGIMEAALYAARILGGKLGIVSLGDRARIMQEEAVRYYGLEAFSVGCEPTGLGVLELETKPQSEVLAAVAGAAKRLVDEKRADCIMLGCAGMVEMRRACEEAVGAADRKAMVIDGVGVGIQFLIGVLSEGLKTAKGGVYRSAAQGRKDRGQDWL